MFNSIIPNVSASNTSSFLAIIIASVNGTTTVSLLDDILNAGLHSLLLFAYNNYTLVLILFGFQSLEVFP